MGKALQKSTLLEEAQEGFSHGNTERTRTALVAHDIKDKELGLHFISNVLKKMFQMRDT